MFNFFLLLCLLLPFQIALNPTSGVDLASVRVAILALSALWLARGLKNKKINISRGVTTGGISLFLFFSFLSIIVSKNSDWSLRKLLFLFSIFPVYFVAGDIFSSWEKVSRAMRFLVGGGALVAAMGILQFILQFPFGVGKVFEIWSSVIAPPFLGTNVTGAVLKNPSWLVNIAGETIMRATATFPDPHMFSFYLGMLVFPAAGLYIATKKNIYLLSFLLIFTADILTFSRGGYVGLIAGIVFLAAFFLFRMERKYKWTVMIVFFIAGVVVIIPSPVSQRLASSFDLKEGSNSGRIEMWQKSSEAFLDNPVLGVGIGNYPLEVKASADYREPIYAHNTYLDVASETGMFGLLGWMMILGGAFFGFLKRTKEDPVFLFFAASMVVFSGHSFFDTAIYSPVNLTLLLIILSFGAVGFGHRMSKNS